VTRNRIALIVKVLVLVLCCHAQAQSLDAFLDNSTVKVGVSLAYGGGITWLSTSGGVNLVNNHDKGRQIQQSYYAGNSVTAANQSSAWSPWAWNPIMVGDYAGHASPVLVLNKSGGQLYVKTQPYLWDRNNQLAQAFMEQWISLHPTLTNVVVVYSRLTCFRNPNDEWGAPVVRNQELPAVYLVSALNTIKAYTNALPWQSHTLSTIPNTPASGTFPWVRYTPTEPWTACVDGTGFGAGVYTPIATSFLAGKSGSAVVWDTANSSTMYISPLGNYAFATNSVFSYRYYLIVGNLTSIRAAVYTLRSESDTAPLPPTGLTATAGDMRANLTWNPSPDTTNYTVRCATNSGGPYTVISSVTTTAYAHTGLTNGVQYYYAVSASNSVGEGAASPPVSVTPLPIIAVPNSGFETPSIPTYQYTPGGASWSFRGSSGISRNGSAFTAGNPNAPEGVQVALLQQSGAFSNMLSGFTPGSVYRVTFAAAQRASNVAGQTWSLKINGKVIGSFAPAKTATLYSDYAVLFIAAAESNSLAFEGSNLNGGDNTVFIDNVRLLRAPDVAVVDHTDGATNMSEGVTQLRGQVACGPMDVRIYWGAADGGTNKANWGNSCLLTNVAAGSFSTSVSNLLYGLKYYYRCYASNGSSVAWAPATTSFISQPVTVTGPVIGNFSFEIPALPASGWSNNPTGATWTFHQAGIARNGSPWYVPSAPAGLQGGYMQRTGATLSQWVTVASAGRYTVSFSVVGRTGYGSQPMAVLMDDVNVLSLSTSQISTSGWTSFTSSVFALSAGAHELTFVNGAFAGDHANVIDDVRFNTGLSGYIVNRPGIAKSAALEAGATLACTGAVYDVYVHWNTTSGGTNAALWVNAAQVGSWANIGQTNLSYRINGLNPNSTYYFTFRAVNEAEEIWAGNIQSCSTLDYDAGTMLRLL